MVKCWNYDLASDAFNEAFEKAVKVPINDRYEIIYNVITQIRDNIDPEYKEEIIQDIDVFLDDFPNFKDSIKNYKDAFNPEFNLERALKRMSELDGEETDFEKINRKAQVKKEFLVNKFKDASSKTHAGRAMQYFEKTALLKLMNAFVADRNEGYLVSENNVTQNVKKLKQELLDTVLDYLESVGVSRDSLGYTQLYNESGEYLSIIYKGSPIDSAIKSHLKLGQAFVTDRIKDAYKNFKLKLNDWKRDQKFIEAYNAKLLLYDFDAITTMLLDSLIKPGGLRYNDLSNDVYETKFHRATNMWSNGTGDEVENVSDLISDVTQRLVETSRKYSWKSNTPREDAYITFKDFGHIITKIKDLVRNPNSKNIVLNLRFFDQAANRNYKPTDDANYTLSTLKRLKKSQGLVDTDPTFEDVLSFISDNPLRHIHTIFDLLCNSNILTNFSGITDADKDLIWSLGKELFGHWNESEDIDGTKIASRSLYDLYQNSEDDKILTIITQIADSMFAEQFLQYYEDLDGTLKMRFLKDFAISQTKFDLLRQIRLTNGLLDELRFDKFVLEFNINLDTRDERKIQSKKQDPWLYQNKDSKTGWSYVPGTFLNKVEIPIGKYMTIVCEGGKIKPLVLGDNLKSNDLETIWKSSELRNFVKAAIGIDFNTDIDLASAYENCFKEVKNGKSEVQYFQLLTDLQNLCGVAVFNQAFNNKIVPKNLESGKRQRIPNNVRTLMTMQYGTEAPLLDPETGCVEILPNNLKDSYLQKLATARSDAHGLLTAAQVKTGEGTSLANQCLSCLKASYAYQILTQNKNKDSATRELTFVNNKNGLFQDIVEIREIKTEDIVKPNTNLSAVEAFTASFLGGFVGAFVDDNDTTTINRRGMAYIIPTVDSDKVKQQALALNLNSVSTYTKKRYRDMSNSELEFEMRQEFGNLYDKVVTNINNELFKLLDLTKTPRTIIPNSSFGVENYRNLLDRLTSILCNEDSLLNTVESKNEGKEIAAEIQNLRLTSPKLTAKEIVDTLCKNKDFAEIIGGVRKKQITKEIHNLTTLYNKTHRRQPIELCEQIHFIYDKSGKLTPNNTLISLWGRFKADDAARDYLNIASLYPKGHKASASIEGFFKYEKDIKMAEELLEDGFEIFLLGNLAKENQSELNVLRQYTDWITDSGKMAIAKVFVPKHKYRIGDTFVDKTGAEVEVTGITDSSYGTQYTIQTSVENNINLGTVTESYLDGEVSKAVSFDRGSIENSEGTWVITQDANEVAKRYNSDLLRDTIKVHPMLTKLNRMFYLTTQQYTCSVGGSHYIYKASGDNVLEEEGARWLASNKRNVNYVSTVHKFQNKLLNGVPKFYLMAPIEDIKSIIYNVMGDIDSHKPIDGGMHVIPWLSILENISLAGEAAGADKKQFGTYYYEKYAAGGIIKTAGFVISNLRMRDSQAYRNLCANLTDRTWIKEYTNAEGADIEEYLDVTRDWKGNLLNWVQDPNGHETFYERKSDDGKLHRYKLGRIEAIYTNGVEERSFEGAVPKGWRPTNKYKIYEFPVDRYGLIDKKHPDIAALIPSKDDTSPEAQKLRDEDLKPILRTEGADLDGNILINTNWKLYNTLFGGYYSLSLNNDGVLKASENSVYLIVHALNNIGYLRTIENNDPNFGEDKYIAKRFNKVVSQDELWQPLKYSDVQYAPNIGALKSTQMNVNPKEAMIEKMDVNAMVIRMAQLGIQLDKEHHADDSEVSMPTQIISACANKGYTIKYTDKLFKSLSTLTELSIKDCMDGIMELMPEGENKGTLLTTVADIIVKKLIKSQDDKAAMEAAMEYIVEKARKGQKIKPEDVIGNVPWSDNVLYKTVYNDIASHFTNNAIKMKFPGTLSVICPTEKFQQMYGNKRLSTYRDADKQLSEELGLILYQLEILDGKYPELMIYDSTKYYGKNDIPDITKKLEPSVIEKLSMASNLETQHHYWIEWMDKDGNVVMNGAVPARESITIELPSDYFKVKDWLAYGRTSGKIGDTNISAENLRVHKIYENVTEGRELGAYNARFSVMENSDNGNPLRFCIFDLDSVQKLFAFNDLKKNLDNAKKLLQENKLYDSEDTKKKLAIMFKNKYPESYGKFVAELKRHPGKTLAEIVELMGGDVQKDYIDAVFKLCKVLTYKTMESDLFKISKDYNGARQLYVNGDLLTVNPDTIQTTAYELIMPKVYQSRFNLEPDDLVQDILADEQFFTKRAVNRLKKLHISDKNFHWELKRFNGEHIYIWDAKYGQPDPEIFEEIEIDKQEDSSGKWIRTDIEKNYMYGLASQYDKVMKAGKFGYEVIVTRDPAFYMNNMDYNLITFSNTNVTELQAQELADELKDSLKSQANYFSRILLDKSGKLRELKWLRKRNNTIHSITSEQILNPDWIKDRDVKSTIKRIRREGSELHASFNKSLDIIAGRIPAQSLQSFMPQRVVAFDDNNINTAYVSTFQLFLLGSKK